MHSHENKDIGGFLPCQTTNKLRSHQKNAHAHTGSHLSYCTDTEALTQAHTHAHTHTLAGSDRSLLSLAPCCRVLQGRSMVLERTMFHDRNLAATWLDQAQRNNLLTDCSSAGTQGWEGQRRQEEEEEQREERS